MNPHLTDIHNDRMYHIGYNRDEVKELFGDVKVSICIYMYVLNNHVYNNVCIE